MIWFLGVLEVHTQSIQTHTPNRLNDQSQECWYLDDLDLNITGFRETTNAFALVQVIALVRLGMNRPDCTLETGIDWELASPGHLNSQPKSLGSYGLEVPLWSVRSGGLGQCVGIFSGVWVRWPSSSSHFCVIPWFPKTCFWSHPPRGPHVARQAHSLLRTRPPLWEKNTRPLEVSIVVARIGWFSGVEMCLIPFPKWSRFWVRKTQPLSVCDQVSAFWWAWVRRPTWEAQLSSLNSECVLLWMVTRFSFPLSVTGRKQMMALHT